MLDNNPLKQYFRRPSIYFRLPSDAQYYDAAVVNMPVNRELPVYPMTAIDEMTARTPDALFNGVAVVEIIKSCVPNILDPWQLNSIDLDATLLAIKAATNDGTMSITSTCPACTEQSDYELNIMPMVSNMKNIDYNEILQIRELEIKFRPLTYVETNQNGLEQFQMQKIIESMNSYEDNDKKREVISDAIKQLNDIVIKIVAGTIDWIKTPETTVVDKTFIIDFLNNCDKSTSDVIKNRSVELRSKNELPPLDVSCPECKHQYKQQIVLNVTDFFA